MTASRLTLPYGAINELEIVGTKGRLGINLTRGENERISMLPPGSDSWQRLRLDEDAESDRPGALERMMHAFVDAVLAGTTKQSFDPTFKDGLIAQVAIAAGLQASKGGRCEAISYPDLAHERIQEPSRSGA